MGKTFMVDTYETENSIYQMDTYNFRYRRLVKPGTDEQAVESHRLKYGTWLPLQEFREEPGGCLRIFAPDSTFGILTSPVVSSYTQSVEPGE